MNISRNSGFSLVELLMAILVAAVLIHGVFRLQNHTLNLAAHNRLAWKSINLVQELMAEQGPNRLTDAPGTRPVSLDREKLRWRAVLNQDSSDLKQVELITAWENQEIRWTWPVVP